MALPLLFMAGATLVRAATPAIARYLAKQGLKRATGAAARKPVSSTVTSIKQPQKLIPTKTPLSGTPKVAGKKPVASTVSSAPKPKTTGSAPKPLRADPKQRINKPAPKKKPRDTGLKSAGTLVSAASLLAAIPRGEKKEAKAAKSTTGGMSAQSEARRKIARAEAKEKRLQADSRRAKAAAAAKSKSKSWKDYKTVSAAQKAGLDHFMGRDGKKKIAITQEQLKKSGKSLREYANTLGKKGK